MTTPELRVWPDPVLRAACEPVEHFDADLRELVQVLEQLMAAHQGIGLAAPQIGVTRRVFVCQADGRSLHLVNPEIRPLGEATDQRAEGCLSLPGVGVTVSRPSVVTVQARDPSGRAVSLLLCGLAARVVQHEADHLDGRLIIDRLARGEADEARA